MTYREFKQDRNRLYLEAQQQKKAQHAEDLDQALADYRKSKAELEAVLVPVRRVRS